ncbi:hypothetical protein BASA81_002091 [Batrachochytrium salamandrivorans]|nr:hypothetical protein BASA81_002091 [Batrachochytrium salamandrivorans]
MDLPFFQDEFMLRASDPEVWEEIVALSSLGPPPPTGEGDGGEDNYEEELIARFLQLLTNDSLLPILGRRMSGKLRLLDSDRGRAALATLQACITRAQRQNDDSDDDGGDNEEEKEDCPSSLEALEEMDLIRVQFILADKWKDHSLSFEHYLETQARLVQVEQEAKRRERRIAWLGVFPGMVVVPFVWFLILVSMARIHSIAMVVALVCFLFLEAAFTYVAMVVKSKRGLSTRLLVVLVVLLLAAFSLIVNHPHHWLPAQPFGLAQLLVALVNASLFRDAARGGTEAK